MIPGSNLLRQALGLIGSQPVAYYRYAGRETSPALLDVAYYDEPVTITEGSVQAVPLRNYQYLGLDLKRIYVTWFAPISGAAPIAGLERDRASDQIVWNGRRFNIEGSTSWAAQDGWVECLCVDIGAADA